MKLALAPIFTEDLVADGAVAGLQGAVGLVVTTFQMVVAFEFDQVVAQGSGDRAVNRGVTQAGKFGFVDDLLIDLEFLDPRHWPPLLRLFGADC